MPDLFSSSPNSKRGLEGGIISAKHMVESIVTEINTFEASLADDEQAGGYIMLYGKQHAFEIESVAYRDMFMIIFCGTLPSGERVKLLQNMSQLNLMLVAVKRNNLNEPRRQLGFHSDT
jgi:hypothetical protein